MKKVYKILISCAAGILAFGTGVVTGVGITEKSNYSGTILGDIVEGTGEYDWRKYEVDIAVNSGIDEKEYYTNYKKNCIYDIYYSYSEGREGSTKEHRDPLCIFYSTTFSFYDGLQTFFVLGKGNDRYVTNIERTYFDLFGDSVVFDGSSGYLHALSEYNIKEIWVRTMD